MMVTSYRSGMGLMGLVGLMGPSLWKRKGLDVSVGVIGTAHQRAGLDMPEAQVERLPLQLDEYLRMQVFDHRQMLARRLQILSEGEYVAAVMTEILECLQHFLAALSEPE